MSNLKYLLLFFASFLLISAKQSSCKHSKEVVVATEATEKRSGAFLIKKLKDDPYSKIERLNAQAQIHIEGDGQSFNANANIIFVRDSFIWINIKKFGIEAARALITPDSIHVLNRLEKTVQSNSISTLQKTYNLPAGFDLIQKALLGNAYLLDDKAPVPALKNGLHSLSMTSTTANGEYLLEEGTFRLRTETFIQPLESRIITIDFGDYKKTSNNLWFPYLRAIEAYSPSDDKMKLEVNMSNIEINVVKNWRFEIPAHYKKK